ncbi:ferric reductase-like transmembrane domain-containing protein [Fodinicola acaciae]|uniref:ferric reductase-like transmembrane domain-containing protein n=1 Tax=Fodinicola acaciae TaxID=2681555 RepID=UPI0013D78627|nr:ferric reductase-like transmembrane domain-containing protein [Fodinicola acaciae]
MWPHLVTATTAHSAHDAVVRSVAQAFAHTAYVALCLSLSWGVFVTTGWIGRITGRVPMRRSHATLAVLAISLSVAHAATFLFLTDLDERFSVGALVVPLFPNAPTRWTLGIIAVDLMIAVVLSTALMRFIVYRRWLRFHRLAYLAVALGVAHSWLGAVANGTLAVLWIAGLSALAPTVLVAALRFTPTRYLESTGFLTSARSRDA